MLKQGEVAGVDNGLSELAVPICTSLLAYDSGLSGDSGITDFEQQDGLTDSGIEHVI